MKITEQNASIGVEVRDVHPETFSAEDAVALKEAVYRHRIAILKDLDLDAAAFVELGRLLGEPEIYYQSMYHHPDAPEVFVSSNEGGDQRVGVPKTGQCWHFDYQFMARPFGLTLVHPRVIPAQDRGTYFVDMAAAYRGLPEDVRQRLRGSTAQHSPRRNVKIRPEDVYRPVHEVLADIERETPEVSHPTVIQHPVTGEEILYISEGLTCGITLADGTAAEPELLDSLLRHSGQLDDSFEHEGIHLQFLQPGDLLIWDNRALVHRARHVASNATTVSHRVTVHDEYPFYPGIAPAAVGATA